MVEMKKQKALKQAQKLIDHFNLTWLLFHPDPKKVRKAEKALKISERNFKNGDTH